MNRRIAHLLGAWTVSTFQLLFLRCVFFVDADAQGEPRALKYQD